MTIDECLSNQQIADRLKTPLRTVERWVAEIYAQDNQLLGSNEEAVTQINISKDRLNKIAQDILDEIKNAPPDIPMKDKTDARHLAGEIIATIGMMYVNPPVKLARSHTFAHNPLVDSKASKGLKLVLKKGEDPELVQKEHYIDEDTETYDGEEEYDEEQQSSLNVTPAAEHPVLPWEEA